MSQRIVVVFLQRTARVGRRSIGLRRRLLAAVEARRGELVAAGISEFAVALPGDDWERAATLAVAALRGARRRRFSIGISAGELGAASEPGFRASEPLSRAARLARLAGRGEVLVDGACAGEARLLFHGTLREPYRGGLLAGRRLDLRCPLIRTSRERLPELVVPLLVGRAEVNALRLMPGSVSVVRAAPGFGGTRFLGEVAHTLSPARVLRIAGSGVGEPLGALRRALVRAGATAAHLEPAEARVLDALIAGLGADLDAAASLVSAWLRGEALRLTGTVLVDDAGQVDRDTLDVLALAATHPETPCQNPPWSGRRSSISTRQSPSRGTASQASTTRRGSAGVPVPRGPGGRSIIPASDSARGRGPYGKMPRSR